MIRLVKTENKQYADEKAERLRDHIRRCRSRVNDSVEVREFLDGRGQPIYEVWLHHNTASGRKA